jgi:LPS sulfotransferase NodH
MKILILSHTRSGSTTLCKWLSNELNIELDETPYNKFTFESVLEKTNIIRKIVVEEYIPSNDIISKFDKVICLTRENSIDTSISFIIANNNNTWHTEYGVSNEWIIENKNKIIETKYQYDYLKSKLKKYEVLQITYENFYINKIDISKVIHYLNITNPNYLDMIEHTKKYRKDTYTLSYDFERKNII